MPHQRQNRHAVYGVREKMTKYDTTQPINFKRGMYRIVEDAEKETLFWVEGGN